MNDKFSNQSPAAVEIDLRVRVHGVPPEAVQVRGPGSATESATLGAAERAQQPLIDTDYSSRAGFDESFLGSGIQTPSPSVTDTDEVAALLDGTGHVLKYEHFSIVMHAERRLALYTASNVDYSSDAKHPEPGRDYSRDALNGFGPNIRGEIWLLDDRIKSAAQLDNTFYDKDRGAFDKGHLVRRDDICFGSDYEQVRRANGDTFHSTNCSPQRSNFNQSRRDGIWGNLENFVSAQADTERLSLFAGPILAEDDRWFDGRDGSGDIRVQIPKRYWKIVCANSSGELEVYAFVLLHRIADVTSHEFAVTSEWMPKMVPLSEIEDLVPLLKFHPSLHAADQFEVRRRGRQAREAAMHPANVHDTARANAAPANPG